MRDASTYRGARRNAWRDAGCPPWQNERLAGDNWRQPFEGGLIKHRPAQPAGWPYRQGGRAMMNKVKEIWRYGVGSPQERIATIMRMVAGK